MHGTKQVLTIILRAPNKEFKGEFIKKILLMYCYSQYIFNVMLSKNIIY